MNIKKIIALIITIHLSPIFCSKLAVGIKNQGNTCFMNAVLQCVYHTPELTTFLDTIRQNNSEYYNKGSVATEYLEFIKMYQDALITNKQVITPVKWCNKIWSLEEERLGKTEKRFPKVATGDSAEFLRITLGHLGLDSNKSDINPANITKRLYYPLQQLPENKLTRMLNSIIKTYNADQLLTSIKSESSLTLEIVKEFDSNTLQPKSFVANLKEALNEHLGNRSKFFALPLYLPIIMKRFIPDGITGNTVKLFQNIPFSLELDLSSYLDKNAPPQNSIYELYGIVRHHGSAAHYTTFVKINGKWYECDDFYIKEGPTVAKEVNRLSLSTNPHEDPTPYILFYQQKSPKKIVYKNKALSETKQNISNALNDLPQALKTIIDNLQKAIENNKEDIRTKSEALKVRENKDKTINAKTRYEFFINQNIVYGEVINKLRNLTDPSTLHAYFERYRAAKKIKREDIEKSMTIGLIDANYLTSELASFIGDTVKLETRTRFNKSKKELIDSLASLKEI